MTKLFPTQEIGSLKKPRELIRAWVSPTTSKEELRALQDRASQAVVRRLEAIGLDYVWDGEMHRWEMYQYPVEHIEGFRFVGLVRSWDNKYYRKAACVGPVRLRQDYHTWEFRRVQSFATRPVKIPVTGPYTLADWSYNEYYLSKWSRLVSNPREARHRAKAELSLALAREVLNPILRNLAQAGARVIQIDEPAATTHPKEMDIFVEAFNEAVKGVDAKIVAHICFSDYSKLFPHLAELKVSQLLLEFANRDPVELGLGRDVRRGYGDLYTFREHSSDMELGVGVIDVHTDFLEPPELIRDRILHAAKVIGAERVYVNPDCGLRTRRLEVAYAKLQNMVAGAHQAREAWARGV
jgi:5-methyltetrahydropteroyltriglutamate--homocysteine methyltransferase